MNELDDLLTLVHGAAPVSRLDGIDARVLVEIGRNQLRPYPNDAIFALVIAVALLFGASAVAIPSNVASPHSVSPFDSRFALMPSNLLAIQ